MRRILILLLTGAVVAATAGTPAHAAPPAQRDSASPGSRLWGRECLRHAAVRAVQQALRGGCGHQRTRPTPFGGPDTAGKVATTACGGTWVITPSTLKGKEQVRFLGQ